MRRNCTNPLNARVHGSPQPNSTGHDGHTRAEVTLLSAVGDDCTTLAAPRDANTRSEAAPVKPSVPVIDDGFGRLVRKAGYN